MKEDLQRLLDEETICFNAYIEARTRAEEAQKSLIEAQEALLEAKQRSWSALRVTLKIEKNKQ